MIKKKSGSRVQTNVTVAGPLAGYTLATLLLIRNSSWGTRWHPPWFHYKVQCSPSPHTELCELHPPRSLPTLPLWSLFASPMSISPTTDLMTPPPLSFCAKSSVRFCSSMIFQTSISLSSTRFCTVERVRHPSTSSTSCALRLCARSSGAAGSALHALSRTATTVLRF